MENPRGWGQGPAGWCAQKDTELALFLRQFHSRLSPGCVDTEAEPGRSRMINQEEFAGQLQLSDPQAVASAFSYFQKVKELGWTTQSSTFRDGVRVAVSVASEGQFGLCAGCSNSCCQTANF